MKSSQRQIKTNDKYNEYLEELVCCIPGPVSLQPVSKYPSISSLTIHFGMKKLSKICTVLYIATDNEIGQWTVSGPLDRQQQRRRGEVFRTLSQATFRHVDKLQQ